MPNLIRFRRGSATPSAGAFAEGEPAWDSTNKRLFVKAADGSMAEIGAPGEAFLTDDNATNGNYYPIFGTAASGIATLKAGSTGLVFTPSAGRLLMGSAGALTFPGSVVPKLQLQGTVGSSSSLSLSRFSADTNRPFLLFSKSRSGTIGTHAAVANGDLIGSVSFTGSDGSAYIQGAEVRATIEGTPAANAMPARLSFLTTPAGSASSVERLRIRPDGNVCIGASGGGSGNMLSITKDATGAADWASVLMAPSIYPDVNSFVGFQHFAGTRPSAFTLSLNYGYTASQPALGTGSVIDLQVGFYTYASFNGGTTNCGFLSSLAAPTSGVAGPFTVSTISSSGTTVTVDTTVAHLLTNGQIVTVTATANATSLTSGAICTILTAGTTDFTLIGAVDNNVGTQFTATGPGSGTGTVTLNCQNSARTVAGSSGTSFTYTSAVSSTFAAITVLAGTVTVSKSWNFYAGGSADNSFVGDTSFGHSNPAQKVDVIGSGWFRNASNQDGVLISGRAGGVNGRNVTLTPATLSASQTLTLPDATGTIALVGGSSTGILRPPAGVASANGAPLDFAAGTNLTTPEAGAIEYDGTYFYATPTTTSGRGHSGVFQTFRLTSNGSAIGPGIADFFGTTSAINLAATSVYEIEFFAYLQKITAGALTWTLTASSAPTLITGLLRAGPLTGIAAGAPTTLYTGSRAAATAAFGTTGSITASAFMAYEFHVRVITNAATSFKLQVTSGVGTVTPQAGSFYTVRQVSGTTGAFV